MSRLPTRPGRRRPFIALYSNTVLMQVITFVLRPTAIYRGLEIDVSAAWLGALGASFAVLPFLVAVPAGHLADRFGERRVMLGGATTTLLAALMFALFATNVLGLLIAVMLLGLGHLGSAVGQQALVANQTRRNYDAAFGRYTFAVSLGQTLGPALIVFFGGDQAIPNTDSIFRGTAVLAIAVVATALALPRAQGRIAKPTASDGTVLGLLRLPGLLSALTVSSIILAAVDITLVYLPVLGAERGISSGVVGTLLSVRAATSMLSRLFLARLVHRFTRARVLVWSVLLSALTIAALVVPMPLVLLVAVTAVMGFGLGMGQPLTMSWLAEATPVGLRGRAMSLRLTGNRLGQVLVPSAAGALAAGAGAVGVFCLTALVLGGAAAATRKIPHGDS